MPKAGTAFQTRSPTRNMNTKCLPALCYDDINLPRIAARYLSWALVSDSGRTLRRPAGVTLHAKREDSCYSHPLWRCYVFWPLIQRPLGYKSSYNQHHANNVPRPHHAAIRPTNSHNTSYSVPFPSARMASHYIRFTAPFCWHLWTQGHTVGQRYAAFTPAFAAFLRIGASVLPGTLLPSTTCTAPSVPPRKTAA